MKEDEIIKKAKAACSDVAHLEDTLRSAVLRSLASIIRDQSTAVMEANSEDVSKFDSNNPMVDRLLLNESRIEDVCNGVEAIAALPSPVGKVIDTKTVANGLGISRIVVPLGLVGVVCESRPHVMVDVFTVCFKSGNTCIFKGGEEAVSTNRKFFELIQLALQEHNISKDVISMLSCKESSVKTLIQSSEVDVCIPRGGQDLVDSIMAAAKVPVINTSAGMVHVYFDEGGDVAKGKQIILNSKCRRVAACNALDCLLIHKRRLSDLVSLVELLEDKNVEIFADEATYSVLKDHYRWLNRARDEDFETEFLDSKLAVRVVQDLDGAIGYISENTCGHTECIITEDLAAAEFFIKRVDAAAVYSNAATSFSDGEEFGIGVEVGISTQKLHVRGPFALEGLTTYKWIVRGAGQVRP